MVHLHNRYNLTSYSNQPHWPLVAPTSTGMAVFFYVEGHEDPPPPGTRFREAWCPVGRVNGPLPSPASTWDQAGCWLLCGRVSRYLCTMPNVSPGDVKRVHWDTKVLFPRFGSWLNRLPRWNSQSAYRPACFLSFAIGLGASADKCCKKKLGDQFPFPSPLPPQCPSLLNNRIFISLLKICGAFR